MKPSLFRAAAPAAVLFSTVVLGGCNVASIHAAVSSDAAASLPTICSLGAAAHASFATIAAAGKLSTGAVSDEAASYAGLKVVCANPPSDIGSALTSAASAYSAVVSALHIAQKSG